MRKSRYQAYPALAAIKELDRLAYTQPERANHQGGNVKRSKAGRTNEGEGWDTGPGKIARHRAKIIPITGRKREDGSLPFGDIVWQTPPECVAHTVDSKTERVPRDVAGAETLRARLRNRGFRGEHFQLAMALIEDALRVLIAGYKGKEKIVGAQHHTDTPTFLRETHYWMFLEVDLFAERVCSLEWCVQAINAACDMSLTSNAFRDEACRLGLYEKGAGCRA
jgi:hypothetical protein